jgi:hypothetical protein
MKPETDMLQEQQPMVRKRRLSFPQWGSGRSQQETLSMSESVSEEVKRLRKVFFVTDSEDEEDEEDEDDKEEADE